MDPRTKCEARRSSSCVKRSCSRENSVRPERGSPSVRRGSPSALGAVPPEADPTVLVSPEKAQVVEDALCAPPSALPLLIRVVVTLNVRPFGMSPVKEGVAGYVVAKLAANNPASNAGVRIGWRLIEVGGTSCRDWDVEAVKALMQGVALPVQLAFEQPAAESELPSEDEEEEEEEDLQDARAEQRRQHTSTLCQLDDLPVSRDPEHPEPIKSWQDACNRGVLSKAVVDKLLTAGLKRPTLIQRHAVPIVSDGSDLIALAQTGSGKTFAFVIPTVARILADPMPRPFFPGKSPGGPLLLVLSPTRELAMQTTKEIEVLAKGALSQVCIYGGESLKYQQQRIEKSQIDILCATPGRLVDLIDAGKITLSFVRSVVLDEADQMLEQSLEVMCAEILTGRDMPEPRHRQTLLFSATMPQKIRDMCPKIMRQDRLTNLTIGHYGEDHGGSCASIKQILRWAPDETQRIPVLVDDLRTRWLNVGKAGRVVIFTNQRLQANMLAGSLMQQGISCVHLHGKLEQHVREEVFEKFRRGQSDVLVATNVASRGLDFPDIAFVVQYNLPANIDIYTHRIGRTGRVGQVGCALSYVGPKDQKLFPKLVEFLELNRQEVPAFLHRGSGRDRRSRSRRRR